MFFDTIGSILVCQISAEIYLRPIDSKHIISFFFNSLVIICDAHKIFFNKPRATITKNNLGCLCKITLQISGTDYKKKI